MFDYNKTLLCEHISRRVKIGTSDVLNQLSSEHQAATSYSTRNWTLLEFCSIFGGRSSFNYFLKLSSHNCLEFAIIKKEMIVGSRWEIMYKFFNVSTTLNRHKTHTFDPDIPMCWKTHRTTAGISAFMVWWTIR